MQLKVKKRGAKEKRSGIELAEVNGLSQATSNEN